MLNLFARNEFSHQQNKKISIVNSRKNMDPKTGAIKKTFVRNVEIPTHQSVNRGRVVKNYSSSSLGHNDRPIDRDHQLLRRSDPVVGTSTRLSRKDLFQQSLKYRIPALNTSEKMKEAIEKMEKMQIRRETNIDELTPRSKAYVNQEITKKLNFLPDQRIFKNLIPINVNDSQLLTPEKKKPFRKKYVAKASKDPVPELSDFLTPIPPIKHVIPLEDKPSIPYKPDNSFYKSIYELHVNFHPDS